MKRGNGLSISWKVAIILIGAVAVIAFIVALANYSFYSAPIYENARLGPGMGYQGGNRYTPGQENCGFENMCLPGECPLPWNDPATPWNDAQGTTCCVIHLSDYPDWAEPFCPILGEGRRYACVINPADCVSGTGPAYN